ncbi:unnamed protein product [Protopolystoma xenopodis]|uniref:Uncharacterized protein n=1 Tax=Protopolystoma xenopodis TaxID=117903 RepID=A0A448WDG4_9PLAT|nr:unnamed protein product [Protopolystoma xenopodis]
MSLNNIHIPLMARFYLLKKPRANCYSPVPQSSLFPLFINVSVTRRRVDLLIKERIELLGKQLSCDEPTTGEQSMTQQLSVLRNWSASNEHFQDEVGVTKSIDVSVQETAGSRHEIEEGLELKKRTSRVELIHPKENRSEDDVTCINEITNTSKDGETIGLISEAHDLRHCVKAVNDDEFTLFHRIRLPEISLPNSKLTERLAQKQAAAAIAVEHLRIKVKPSTRIEAEFIIF